MGGFHLNNKDLDFDEETKKLIDEILKETEDAKCTSQIESDAPNKALTIMFAIVVVVFGMFLFDKLVLGGSLADAIKSLFA